MQHKDIFLPNLYAVAALTSNREAVPATRALIKDVIDTEELKAGMNSAVDELLVLRN